LIVLLAALACAGSWAAGQVRSMRDRSEVAKMTEKRKTVCVGRYLVDVPVQATVSLSGGMLNGFEIETVEESEDVFQQRIASREAEIVARGANAGSDGPGGMIEARDLAVAGMTGRTLIYGRTRSYGFEGERRVESEYVSVESHGHMAGLSFSLKMKYADDQDTRSVEQVMARLRLRREDEIPAVPGFCVQRGIFVEPLPAHKNEHMVMHLGVPGHPDLAMVLFSIAGGNPGPSLLTRVAHTDATSSADELLRVSKLRSDIRSINGLDGEELVERVREYNFTTGYAFNWETRGATDDVLRPYLSLEMQTGVSERPGGKPTDTSLHEDALLDLWDSVASSIRLRRSDPPPRSGPAPEPPGPKLGTVASAGDVCPQTGWWQCNAGGPGLDVHGGQVQYLRKGERMPQALLLPRQSLWQKVKGVQPSIESEQPTAWKLVDKRQRPRTSASVPLAQPGVPASGFELAVDGGRGAAIGTYVRTGDLCPVSGWWRCDDPHALDGARWFARGSVLPVVTFQVPTGVFTRPGGPDFIQRRSGWQLVRQAEAPAQSQEVLEVAAGLSPPEPPVTV
jgi:hypothetical protein